MKKKYKLLTLFTKKTCYAVIAITLLSVESFASYNNYDSRLQSKTIQQLNEKRVTLKVTDKSLDYILLEINRQTGVGYGFQYNQKINSERIFTIDVKNMTLKQTLDKLLSNSDLTYIIKNNKIVVKSKDATNLEDKTRQQKIITIKGKVLDKDKAPIIGATIFVSHKDFNRGTISDENGEYKLMLPLVDKLEILYTCIGKKEVKVIYAGNDNINVVMDDDVVTVDEVVVTGYGNISKNSFTGNSRTISADEIKRISPNNVMQSLEILDPSFRLKTNNYAGSNPNSLPDLSVRGVSGIGISQTDDALLSEANINTNPNLPTFIMDGFEISAQKMFDLDVNRIKSITILKDAAATAIYGSRAANGVIIVTTYPPIPGEIRVTYNYGLTVQTPDLTGYNLLNVKEKLEVEKAAGLFEGTNGISDYNKKMKLIEQGNNTDWIALPLRNTASSKHYLKVEGGGDGLRYAIDASYGTNNGVMKESQRRNYGASVELQYNVKKLIFRNVTGYNATNQQESPYGNFSEYTRMNPYLSYVDQYGIIQRRLELPGYNQYLVNPMYEATLGNYDKKNLEEIFNNLNIQYNITSKINFKASLSLKSINDRAEKYKDPLSGKFINSNYKGEISMGRTKTIDIYGKMYGYYNDIVGKHNINMLAGVDISESSSRTENYYFRDLPLGGFTNPQFARDLTKSPSTFMQKSRLFSVLVSANYTYDNIYLVDLTGRMDGSSAFGTKKRFAPFWSTGFGVNIHNYESMKSVKWISEFKIRGSYGTTGKANFPTRTARTVYTVNYEGSYATGIGSTMQALGNQNLKWEKTNIADVGFVLGLFRDKLTINASYYNRKTVDLIADINIPSSSGFLTYKDNVGQMTNKGFEIDLRYKLIGTRNTTLYIAASAAHNKNRIDKISETLKAYNKKVEELYSEAHSYTPMLKYNEGSSVTSIYAMPSLGIDPQTGKELFIHPDGSVDTRWVAADNIVVGNTDPKINGTISANLYHKGLSFNVYFGYRFGGQQYNETLRTKIENADPKFNADKRVLTDRWINPGDVSKFKSIKEYNKPTNPTTRFVEDDDAFSLRSVSVGYELPKTLLNKTFLQTVKLSFNMNDIFQITSIKQERGLSYPFARSFTFTLNVSF